MVKYKKKRVRELQHDRFRDTTMGVLDRLGNLLEGKGRAIFYGIAVAIFIGAIAAFFLRWSHRKSDEARRALGRGITIVTTPVSSTPSTDANNPSFSTEQERAQRAVEEFQKVAAKYGEPYRSQARYLAATNLLTVDRTKGVSELTELSTSANNEIATLAKFALAQAKESDSSFDEAAKLYADLAKQNSLVVTPETANLRLAIVYEKQGKKSEAANILFNIVDAARKSKDKEGTPLPQSGAAREAAKELQKVDPDRYAQLPPEVPAGGISF